MFGWMDLGQNFATSDERESIAISCFATLEFGISKKTGRLAIYLRLARHVYLLGMMKDRLIIQM